MLHSTNRSADAQKRRDAHGRTCQALHVMKTNRKTIKVKKDFRIDPSLAAQTAAHAAQWGVTETAIVETGLREFFAVERTALQKKD